MLHSKFSRDLDSVLPGLACVSVAKTVVYRSPRALLYPALRTGSAIWTDNPGVRVAPEVLDVVMGVTECAGGAGIGLPVTMRDIAIRHGGRVRLHRDGPVLLPAVMLGAEASIPGGVGAVSGGTKISFHLLSIAGFSRLRPL